MRDLQTQMSENKQKNDKFNNEEIQLEQTNNNTLDQQYQQREQLINEHQKMIYERDDQINSHMNVSIRLIIIMLQDPNVITYSKEEMKKTMNI